MDFPPVPLWAVKSPPWSTVIEGGRVRSVYNECTASKKNELKEGMLHKKETMSRSADAHARKHSKQVGPTFGGNRIQRIRN